MVHQHYQMTKENQELLPLQVDACQQGCPSLTDLQGNQPYPNHMISVIPIRHHHYQQSTVDTFSIDIKRSNTQATLHWPLL